MLERHRPTNFESPYSGSADLCSMLVITRKSMEDTPSYAGIHLKVVITGPLMVHKGILTRLGTEI